jgi:hypothetical protein
MARLHLGLWVVIGAMGCAAAPPQPEPDSATATAPSATATATPDPPVASTASTSPPVPSATPSASAPAATGFPTGFKILVIGDSFAEALGVGLKAREKERAIKVTLQGEKSTYIPEWAGPNRNVAGLVKQFAPSLVVISLGGNELAMTDPSVRGPKVAKLIEQVKSVPCVWVAPPLWGNKDNGLLEVIRTNSGPCRYFDSNILSPALPRGSDKIHPTAEGQKQWADALLGWLLRERDGDVTPFMLKSRPATE